jgi:lambda family phage portal protein
MIQWAGRQLAGIGARLAGRAGTASGGMHAARAFRQLMGGYDAAAARGFDAATWAETDSDSADAAASPAKRQRIRDRCRHVVNNWPIARGMANTLADDTVGTGPRLSVMVADDGDARGLTDDDAARVEQAFAAWWNAAGMGEKLRVLRLAKVTDGEVFARLTTNEALVPRCGVAVDVRPLEADQVATPEPDLADPLEVDGIRFDRSGNVTSYQVLRFHPGDDRGTLGNPYEADTVPAAQMLHYFAATRPGQSRGVSELASAVRLIGQHWRFFAATIQAAETAANIAAYMETTTSFDGTEGDLFDAMDLEAGSILTLPEGYKIQQLDAKHPNAVFSEVHRAIIAATARCLSMPVNVAMGDSSSHNYASARQDHQVYRAAIDVERARMVAQVLDPVYRAWLDEAARVDGLLPQAARTLAGVPHTWTWPAWRHVDPVKEATADEIRLRIGSTTLRRIWADAGGDYRDGLKQLARERREAAALGLELGDHAAAAADEGAPDE